MDKAPNDMHLDGDALCDYAEGMLEGPARARAEIHLQGCAACRKEADALRGYFREMAGLEPVHAPAGFLAKVHARLPRPSPWKKALSVFSRPWRAIPVQIAFLTLLGVTGITAYLYQRGGLESEILPMSASRDAAPALRESAKAGEAPGGEAPASEALVRKPPAPPAPRAKSYDARKSGGSAPKAKAPAPASGQTRLDPAKPRSEPAEAMSVPESLSKRGISAEEDKLSDRDVSAEKSISGSALHAHRGVSREISIRMAAIKDTTAMLAGLRAMGTEMKRFGMPNPEYVLFLPASRLAENLAYLRRYGTIHGDDAAIPDSSTAPIAVVLRIR